MADTRCPMCGKPNPAEANACRFCGARLKPMQYGASTPPAAPPPAGGEGEADWMSDLRGDMMRNRPKTSMLPPEPPAPAPPSDDWLNKIDDRGGKKPARASRLPPIRFPRRSTACQSRTSGARGSRTAARRARTAGMAFESARPGFFRAADRGAGGIRTGQRRSGVA